MSPPRLHHFGMIVDDIEQFLTNSMWELRGEIISDPLQHARLCMVGLKGEPSTSPRPIVELVQPSGEQSPAHCAGTKGGGWHHVCLSFPTMGDGDEFAGSQRMLPVTRWEPAVLFDGRPVRFFYSRNRELIELISDERVSETAG